MVFTKRSCLVACAMALITCGPSANVWAQRNESQGDAPVAVVHNAHPAIEWQMPGQFGVFITLLEEGGQEAFEFRVAHDTSRGMIGGTPGRLYVTRDKVTWEPDVRSQKRDAPFSVVRSEIDSRTHSWDLFKVSGRNYGFGVLPEDEKGKTWFDLDEGYCEEEGLRGKACNHFLDGFDERMSAVVSPEGYDGPFWNWYHLAFSDFNSAVRKFTTLTSNLSVPLPASQQAGLTSRETAGDAAAQAGKLYDALQDYETALQALPAQWAPRDVEQRLEEKAIKLVLRMNPRPAIPQDAMRHMAYAQTAFQEAKGPADLDNAAQELNKALRLAPWWGAAYKNLGLLDEKASRYADAARNLQLYLLAAPNAPDAQSVQMKIYSLQYKAKQQEAAGRSVSTGTPLGKRKKTHKR